MPPSASYASGSLRRGSTTHRTCNVSVVCTPHCWTEDPWPTDDCESAETSTEACKDLQDLLPVQEHHAHTSISTASSSNKKRKDYAFWRQFDTKPSIILGCPSAAAISIAAACIRAVPHLLGRLAAARLRQTGLSARCPCCLGTQTGTGS